jgi:transcriptional regulator with XRE-family HTH domain
MAAIDTVDERRRELGEFLKSRRARLTPEVLGLADCGRRRTPGLRREEVASDAGVGLTWYTWLEQGRPINASAQVLAAVARTLRLDRFERAHLFALAAVPDPDLPTEPEDVPASVRALLAQLDPLPAHVATARYDVLAWNDGYAAVMGDLSTLPCDRRNALLLLFFEPAWRAMLLDRPRDLGHLVAQFRANMASHVGEPAWTSLVAELEASEEFRELWARHEVGGPATKRKRYLHPVGGLIELESTSLWLADQPGARLVVGVPVDEAAREALELLVEEPPWQPWCSAVRGAVAAD